MAEVRTEVRRTFIEGQGWLVEEVAIGAAAVVGEAVAKVLTAADVSPELARQVIESTGQVVVPVSFLNPDQLAELKITIPAGQGGPGSVAAPDTPAAASTVAAPAAAQAHKLNAEQKIALVQKAADFEELNALMADESRKTVILAAEARATELKAQGAK